MYVDQWVLFATLCGSVEFKLITITTTTTTTTTIIIIIINN